MANDPPVARGTPLTLRQLQTIALRVPADERTVAKVLLGEPLPREPHKQEAIIRVATELHPDHTWPVSSTPGVDDPTDGAHACGT